MTNTLTTLNDAQLRDRLLTLDEAAWREFHRRYDRMVWTCVHRVVARFSGVVPSDALHEIRANFYAALLANDLHKLRTFDVERGNKLGSWIGLIAINAAWDYLRTCARRPTAPLFAAEGLHSEEADLFTVSAARQECARLADVVGGLPPRDREFVRLYFVDGRSPQEVADALGMNVKSVYTKKHRLTRHLRDALRARLDALPAAA
ncbi:MAG: sigma-70 family RNA polymerase sigma factor [Polyangiales bacterium]